MEFFVPVPNPCVGYHMSLLDCIQCHTQGFIEHSKPNIPRAIING